ncbi:hypothetical protein OR16_31614 [Cupriavidus basilensis OR16]|uniref:Sulfate transporter n=1 Tax=Cupriavidus basilensis OR16 TaxID=1127483 RepID=H1SDL7_9BURK|nr:DUF3164 family protein [Cupriavidus basilensis]EHP39402.1 hypothetical protein OR16_31614 [Cupriavidus basilensis OR16]
MTQAATTIPTGYMQDARGRLIREEMVKPIDRTRDQIVGELVALAKRQSQALAEFKKRVFGDAEAFISMSAEEYGAKVGGAKGNVTLFSFDGRYKVQIARAENITFDERLQAAKVMIDELLAEWTLGARPELQAIIQGAFETDKEGNLNTGRILSLRRLDIQDPRWKKAMYAISDSVQVIGTKAYVRFYERVGDSEEYRPISLDIAKI